MTKKYLVGVEDEPGIWFFMIANEKVYDKCIAALAVNDIYYIVHLLSENDIVGNNCARIHMNVDEMLVLAPQLAQCYGVDDYCLSPYAMEGIR